MSLEASGSQARGLDMSEKKKKKAENVELNMRRTELQLGLPGSPEEEENESTQEGNDAEEHGDGYARKSENATGSSRFGQIRDAPSWHLRGGVGSSSSSSSCHLKHQRSEAEIQDCVEKHEDGARAPVGWPPVQSFRKNSLNAPNPSKSVDNTASNPAPGTSQQSVASHLVKVYMDGVPIGRKVNLRTHSSYEKLSSALEEMFRRFITGQTGTSKAMKEKLNESKKFNFIYGSDYVLTYEDKDGDLMLVGDVPWGMFVGTVKRLRIMKGSEAIGLAPRVAEEQQTAAAK